MQAQSPQAAGSESAAHFLSEASHVLAKSFDLSLTLPRVARLAAANMAEWCLIEILRDDGQPMIAAGVSRHDGADELVWNAADRGLDESERPLLLDAVPKRWWRKVGLVPAAIEPIAVRGQRLGTLVLAASIASKGPVAVDLELARELAARLSNAIDNAQRFMREQRVARSFQTALLPRTFPRITGCRFHASYAPATDEAEVGGDWYDAFDLPDGRVAMSIGDVAGHGLEAAVVMGEVRQTFRVAAMENRDPAAVLDMANRLLLLRAESTMVTAIFGTYDGATFTYASAGHPPPILGTLDGGVERLPIAGIPLGVDGASSHVSWTVTIPPGSILVLYTDGLIESGHDVVSGEKVLIEAVRAELARPTPDPARSIREQVLGERRNLDDVAILTFTLEETPMQQLDLHYSAAPVAARLVRQSVSRFARDTGLSDEQQFALNVAIGEAVNNVIEHAYLRAPGAFSVRVHREDGRRIVCVVEDKGSWRRARREGRGHGLSIIRSLMDGVEVNLSQGGTMIKMVYDVSEGE